MLNFLRFLSLLILHYTLVGLRYLVVFHYRFYLKILKNNFLLCSSFYVSDALSVTDFLSYSARTRKLNFLSCSLFLNKFATRLQKKGVKYHAIVWENFLAFFKFLTFTNALILLPQLFFTQYHLPYKISVVTFSNRRYYFPNPFNTETETHRFFMKKFGLVLNKRTESFYLGRFFAELIAYLTQTSTSSFRSLLDAVVAQGMENRAYIHYRWVLCKK